MSGTSPSWHRKLLMRVTAAHVAAIFLLFIASLFSLPRNPNLVPLHVSLVSLPSTPSPAPGPVTPTPPVTPEPPRPAPPAPEPAPRPEPKPEPRPKPPPPKPPEPRLPKKRWKPRTPEEIRKSFEQTPRPAPRPQVPTSNLKVDARDIAARINKQVNNLRVAVIPTPGASTSSAPPTSQREAASYFAAVSAVLHRLWQQPDRGAVGRTEPTVTVSLTVASDGRLVRCRTVRRSGVGAMDRSVASVLRGLDRLPAPASHGIRRKEITIEVVFDLD